MSLAKHSKRLHNWLLSFIIFIFACSFAVWGIRELLFPPTDVCALERTEGKNLLDISQVYPIKNNIELIGHVGGKAESVFARGNIAFVKLGLELAAFDVQVPSSPTRIGYILIPGDLIHVDTNGNFAYIHSPDDRLGLWKVDISNPAQMSAINVYNSKFNITSIRLLDEQAYITTRKCEYISFLEGSITTRCDNTIHIVDTSNLAKPNQCYQGIWGEAIRMFAKSRALELITVSETAYQGKYKYSIDKNEGFEIYDASNPIYPIEIGSYSPSYEFIDVIAYGPYAFATSAEYQDLDRRTRYALHMFDVATPADPKDLGELLHKPVIATEFEPFALLTGQFGDGKWPTGVEIFDMSLPNSGGALLAPTQLANVVNMIVIDKHAYATTNDNRLLILDISNVEKPGTIASHSLGRPDQLSYGISVIDNYAYIIVRDVGMRILDISDDLNIVDVGEYRMDTIPVELKVKDHYAYVAEWYGTLEIIDVSDPVRPIQVGIYDAGGRINQIQIIKNNLFMTAGKSGMQIVNISDPTSPYLVGSFVTGTFVTGVDVECPYIYISDIDNGLFILKSGLVSVEDCD